MQQSLILKAVEDILVRAYPEARSDENRKEKLVIASIRISSLLKEISDLRRIGNSTDADSLLIQYRKFKAMAEQYASTLGVKFSLNTLYVRKNLEAQVSELKTYGPAGTESAINRMARIMDLVMTRSAVDECREAGMPESEIQEILGEFADQIPPEGPVTAHISGTL